MERLQGADIAVCNKVPIRKAQLEQLDQLKMIAIPATGYDAFDIDVCKARGITVSNVRGYATNTVPEHTFSLILALRRNIVGFRQDVIDGKWQEADQFCFFTHPISRSGGLDTWHYRRRCAWPGCCATGPGIRHAHAFRRA